MDEEPWDAPLREREQWLEDQTNPPDLRPGWAVPSFVRTGVPMMYVPIDSGNGPTNPEDEGSPELWDAPFRQFEIAHARPGAPSFQGTTESPIRDVSGVDEFPDQGGGGADPLRPSLRFEFNDGLVRGDLVPCPDDCQSACDAREDEMERANPGTIYSCTVYETDVIIVGGLITGGDAILTDCFCVPVGTPMGDLDITDPKCWTRAPDLTRCRAECDKLDLDVANCSWRERNNNCIPYWMCVPRNEVPEPDLELIRPPVGRPGGPRRGPR
jgi:hypothetical protein